MKILHVNCGQRNVPSSSSSHIWFSYIYIQSHLCLTRLGFRFILLQFSISEMLLSFTCFPVLFSPHGFFVLFACSFRYFSLSVSRFLTARSFRSLAFCSRNRTMLYSSLSRRRRPLACFSFQSWSSSRRCLRRSWCIRSNLSFLIHWRNMLNSRRVHFIKPLFVMKPSVQTKKRFKVSKQWLTIIKFPAPNIKFLVFWLVYSFPVVSSYFDSPHTGMHCTNCCGTEKAPNIQTFRI